jgi:microcystin degradation protein MlrC
MRRLFFGMLGTETNTFSAIPTGWSVWRNTLLNRRSADGTQTELRGAVFRPLHDAMAARGWSLAAGLQAFAVPAGVTPRRVYESLRDELLADLDAMMPVEGVLLFLHGAMVADGYDDCEGDLLMRVRARVGSKVPIGAELDLHCHLTEAMLTHADVLVGYKHYPHIDTYDRLLDLFHIVADTAEGRVKPTMASAECRMIGLFYTTDQPLARFVERMAALEREPGVLNVWLAHGFPYSDVPSIGSHVIVVTDNDAAKARTLATELRNEFFAMRETVDPPSLTIEAAIGRALDGREFPVTIADTADNTGGGAPGDSTFFLQTLIERGIGDCALGPLYDPGAVAICHDAGAGAHVALRVGGKLGPTSGQPVDVECRVVATADRLIQQLNGGPSNLGACASINIPIAGTGGIDVVLTDRRVQAGSPDLFTKLGIEPTERKLVIVKSTQHFHAGFAPISARVLYTGDRGALGRDITKIPYTRVDTARYWPFNPRPALPN